MGLCDDIRSNKVLVFKGCTILWVTIIIIILVAESFAGLAAHEYGLLYKGVSVTLDNERVYSNGRHFIGLGNYFIKYPRGQQYVEFSSARYDSAGTPPLDVWSSDGQVIYLEAGFYFSLRPEKLVDVYYTYANTDWLLVVQSIASETLRDVATQYDTLSFFTNRTVIDDAMQTALAARLYTEIYCNLTTFNLLGIDLPYSFERAVLQKLISAQDVLTLQRLRDSQLIRQTVSVVEAKGRANITTLEATAQASGFAITKTTEASLFEHYSEIRARELSAVAIALGFETPAQMLQYVYTDIIRTEVGVSARDTVVNVPEVISQV